MMISSALREYDDAKIQVGKWTVNPLCVCVGQPFELPPEQSEEQGDWKYCQFVFSDTATTPEKKA